MRPFWIPVIYLVLALFGKIIFYSRVPVSQAGHITLLIICGFFLISRTGPMVVSSFFANTVHLSQNEATTYKQLARSILWRSDSNEMSKYMVVITAFTIGCGLVPIFLEERIIREALNMQRTIASFLVGSVYANLFMLIHFGFEQLTYLIRLSKVKIKSKD